ncbi:MAG TPA: hypothetical protein PLY09_03615 [Methanothrix sp.]|nr:hypothetical protein [Methanothrix sp.]HPJ83831.1 hypothetical protein [Methanothrix sp.]
MKLGLIVLAMAVVVLTSTAGAYIYERSKIEGVGYRSHELAAGTAEGDSGQKVVRTVSGSGRFFERTEFELDGCRGIINYTQEVEFEYFPISYQTGTYDQKWQDRFCVSNYDAGAVVTEQYSQAEHLQKNTDVRTRSSGSDVTGDLACGMCTGALEANFNSNVIGVAHIGWLSRDPKANEKGRHDEYGRSVEDLTGVFSIEKFIQLWGNDTCGTVSADWLPCI